MTLRKTIFATALLATLSIANQPATAQTCGSEQVMTVAPQLIYKYTSKSSTDNIERRGSNIYVLRGTPSDAGIPRVLVFGMGYGDGEGAGAVDFMEYTGRVPLSSGEDDISGVVQIITHPSCFDLPLDLANPVAVRLVAQHAHLDHANQEFVEAAKATDLLLLGAYYHQKDHQLLTCEGTFEGQQLSDTANCGFVPDDPERPNPFRGHPYTLPINADDWTALGTENDAPCETVVATFDLADGRIVTAYNDDGHTEGGLVLVIEPTASELGLAFLSTSENASACEYPGFEVFVPHNFIPGLPPGS